MNQSVFTVDGRLILERQYRHAIGKVSTEICAGCVEEGESPLEAARRELQEETGYCGGEWTELLCLSPNSSTMDNYCYCYIDRGRRWFRPTFGQFSITPRDLYRIDDAEKTSRQAQTQSPFAELEKHKPRSSALAISFSRRMFCQRSRNAPKSFVNLKGFLNIRK